MSPEEDSAPPEGGNMGMVCLAFLLLALWPVYLITLRISRDLNRNNENTKEWEFFSFEDYFERTKTPMIIVHLYGKKCRFLLDSGAHQNCLDIQFLYTIKDKLKGKTITEGDKIQVGNGAIMDSYGMQVRFNIRNMEFNEDFLVSDLKGLREFSNREGLNVTGILGSEFFDKHKWKIDFDKYIVWHKVKKNEICSK